MSFLHPSLPLQTRTWSFVLTTTDKGSRVSPPSLFLKRRLKKTWTDVLVNGKEMFVLITDTSCTRIKLPPPLFFFSSSISKQSHTVTLIPLFHFVLECKPVILWYRNTFSTYPHLYPPSLLVCSWLNTKVLRFFFKLETKAHKIKNQWTSKFFFCHI